MAHKSVVGRLLIYSIRATLSPIRHAIREMRAYFILCQSIHHYLDVWCEKPSDDESDFGQSAKIS